MAPQCSSWLAVEDSPGSAAGPFLHAEGLQCDHAALVPQRRAPSLCLPAALAFAGTALSLQSSAYTHPSSRPPAPDGLSPCSPGDHPRVSLLDAVITHLQGYLPMQTLALEAVSSCRFVHCLVHACICHQITSWLSSGVSLSHSRSEGPTGQAFPCTTNQCTGHAMSHIWFKHQHGMCL